MSDLAIVVIFFGVASILFLLFVWIVATAIADLCEIAIRAACRWYYTRKD